MNILTKENIALIISIIGAAAWLSPLLFQRNVKPEIRCIPTSYLYLDNAKYTRYIPFREAFIKFKGTIFLVSFTIVSLKNDFNVKEISTKIKFRTNKELSNAHVLFTKDLRIIEGDVSKPIICDAKKNILFQSILRKNEVRELELFFIVEENKHDIEYIELTFVELNKKRQILKISDQDFKYAERY